MTSENELDPAGADTLDTFEFVYDGPSVNEGSMSARDLAEVLDGAAKAFSIVAHERGLGDQYELRVTDVEHASFHLLFEAVAYAKANPAAATAITAGAAVVLNAVTNVVSGAYKVITDIGKLIDARKKLKGRRISTVPATFPDGEVHLVVFGDLLVLSKEQYELLLSQRVDRQLSQIVSPLEANRVDRFDMQRSGTELATVAAPQRDYFDYFEVTEEKSREGTEIVGTLNSLTKNTLKGTFYTSEGIHVPYHYSGGDIAELLRGFSARELLKVRGRVKYGGDGIPTFIEVQDIDFLQRPLLTGDSIDPMS